MGTSKHCVRRMRRRGVLPVEALVVIPILVLVTIAIIEFGTLVTLQDAVAFAAVKGAREAAKYSDIAYVETVVEDVLAPHSIVIGSNASVYLEDPAYGADRSAGTLPCSPPDDPETVPTGYVRVTVCVTSSTQPVLGALEHMGFTLMGKLLSRSAVVKKECPG